jgi:hypothetical protein
MQLKSLKTKILLTLSSVIIGVAAAVTLYNIIHEKGQNDLRMEEAYKNVRLNYEESIRETVHFYTARANSNINSPGVLEAFVSRDHNRLYQLILPRWKVISKENPSLVVMQFHNADGTSLHVFISRMYTEIRSHRSALWLLIFIKSIRLYMDLKRGGRD